MVKTSIIIVTFNSDKYIGNCLESISKCFKDIGHEIIIVDNCSKDGTLDILNKRKDILLIRNGKNQGFAKACNKGARPASGKYLFFINPDIEFKDPIPEKIFVSLSKN
ncbi:MAG: glycosyltransferase, partial [Candidatus Aminicenantaceae bacterium]